MFSADGVAPVDVSSTNPMPVILGAGAALVGKIKLEPTTSTGLVIARVISAATTNATLVKNAAGQVYGWHLFNAGATTSYVKLYNKATAPVVGTDVPVMTIPIPTGQSSVVEFSMGVAFALGIGLGITNGMKDTDATATAAEEVLANILYK